MKAHSNLSKPKYITAQQAAHLFGISAKTLLNRSALPTQDLRYIPSIKFGHSRRKYFEISLLERLFTLAQTGGGAL